MSHIKALLGGCFLSLVLFHLAVFLTKNSSIPAQIDHSAQLATQVLLLSPVVEEVCFRIYIDTLFESKNLFWLSSLLFALAHLSSLSQAQSPLLALLFFLFLMLLSLRNRDLYARSKQISLPILSHLGFNLCSWIL